MVFWSIGLPPSAPMLTVIPPSALTTGSGMSTPCSRMHLAKASIASSGATDGAGEPDAPGAADADGSSRVATPDGAAPPPLQAARTAASRAKARIGRGTGIIADTP